MFYRADSEQTFQGCKYSMVEPTYRHYMCHKMLLQRPLNTTSALRPRPSHCYATALLAGFKSGNLPSGLCDSRLQRYLQISSPVQHLNKITQFVQLKIKKLYLICTGMRCPISTLCFKTGGVKLWGEMKLI